MKTYEEILASQAELAHFNPNHDKLGRFAKNMFGRSKSSKPVDKTKSMDYNKIDKDKLKKYAAIGAISVATALTVIGGVYLVKSGKLDNYLRYGKNSLGGAIGKIGSESASASENIHKNIVNNKIAKLAKPETIQEAIKNTNPNKGNIKYKNNCTVSAIAGVLRTQGYDIQAPHTNGEMKNLLGVVDDCFSFETSQIRNRHTLDGWATAFGASPEKASQMLLKKYGNNASGVCNIMWKDGGGHAFSWKINNGIVSFFCPQKGLDDYVVRNAFWSEIDTNGPLQIARIDDLPINIEGFKKWFG